MVRVTGYGKGGGGRGTRFLGEDRSAFEVLEDRADERYQSKQLMTKAVVAGDGSPTLSFGRLSNMPAALGPLFIEPAEGEILTGPLTAVMPSVCCALEMIEAS